MSQISDTWVRRLSTSSHFLVYRRVTSVTPLMEKPMTYDSFFPHPDCSQAWDSASACYMREPRNSLQHFYNDHDGSRVCRNSAATPACIQASDTCWHKRA